MIKNLAYALLATAAVSLVTLVVLALIVSNINIGYGSSESTNQLITHALLVSLLFATILGNTFVVSELRRMRGASTEDRAVQKTQEL